VHEIPLGAFCARPASSAELEPREDDVTGVRFSPDGLLLAVARSDDELHVYDSRFLGRGRDPMRRFLHWGEDGFVGGDRWGIVDAVWVDGWCGRGLGIVTGGSDGERSFFFFFFRRVFFHFSPALFAHVPLCCVFFFCLTATAAGRLRSVLGRAQVGRRHLKWRGACTGRLRYWTLLRWRSLCGRKAARDVGVPFIKYAFIAHLNLM
jgi:hypothetical protein